MSVSEKDLAAEALTRVLEQFKNKDKLLALIAAFSEQVQSVHDTLLTIRSQTVVLTAEGEQLDGLGSIVGEERFGRDDVPYRLAILARIQLNLSEGTTEDIVNIIRALAGDVSVKIVEYPPAAFVAEVQDAIDPTVVDPTIVGNFVQSARPAGVGAGTRFHVDGAFRYDAGPGFDVGKYAKIF